VLSTVGSFVLSEKFLGGFKALAVVGESEEEII
jgi:hypothetical protein